MPRELLVLHFGDSYDGASANGWHVIRRGDGGEFESLAGPFACKALAVARRNVLEVS